MRQTLWMSVIAACLVAFALPLAAQSSDLVTIKTPRGANQSFILIKPEKPVASVILFAGGHGALGLKNSTEMAWGKGNFLVRSRDKFAAHGLMVAVIDAPSDQQGGMKATFRFSREHASDINAVVSHLKTTADVPVWMVGTSMGTWSAAAGAIQSGNVDGLVLTSTITRAKPEWAIAKSHPNGVASLPLSGFKGPALVMSHKRDACAITPASDAPVLIKALRNTRKAEVIILDGGSPAESDPCEAKSAHGFLGIESDAVARIAAFIKSNGR
jgi:hypothetical protein